MERDKVLCDLLSVDAPCPEILLDEGGDICLDWEVLYVSITPAGEVSWTFLNSKHQEHGSDLKRVKELIAEID